MSVLTLSDIKKKNRSDIYHYIYSNPHCAKQTIANTLSISLPTVSQHLTQLQNKNLIEKCGQLVSSVGRRATAYQINATARIAIGIEILPNKVYLVALNLYGTQEAKAKHELPFQPTKGYFSKLHSLVQNFLSENQLCESHILGIGLGVQGLVSPDGSKITYGKILNCTGLQIQLFSDYFSFPCKFIHDAECASNQELLANPQLCDAIYLSLGYHLGGAIIINRILQNGLTGKTGTFEHMTLIPDGMECYCGKTGCADCYCSGSFLLTQNMELDEFFYQKEHNNVQCQKKWEEYLTYLSRLINNLHMVLEIPIILGGRIGTYITNEDLERIKKRVTDLSAFHEDASYITLGTCCHDAISAGAALPFIQDFLNTMIF